MTCFWNIFCFLLLLSIRYTWSIKYSEFISHSNLSNDYDSTMLLHSAARNMREYSLPMIQTNKFGLPKCINQQNGCRQIGIVGAGEFFLFNI